MPALSDAALAPIGRSKHAWIYACIDALDIGETWEIAKTGHSIRSLNPVRYWFQKKRPGRSVSIHETSRGFMFVRVE